MCYSEQSNLVYRHFMLCVLFVFVFYFDGMLNVGYFFLFLLSYPRELAYEPTTCLCAPLCLTCFVEKGFQHIKIICNTARSHISIFYCGVYERVASHEGISGTAACSLSY